MSLANNAMGLGLRALNRLAGLPVVDRLGLRKPAEKVLYQATRTGFRTVGALNRGFNATRKLSQPARLPSGRAPELFDLTPSEEQQMLRDAVQGFALEQLRTQAAAADTACAAPAELLRQSAELGISLMGVPEDLGGAGNERSAMTNVLVAEAMAQGDMGLAVACLAPAAVSNALVLWGNAEQQAKYLTAFVGDHAPAAALAILEPRPLFDPFKLTMRAHAGGGGYVLDGVKSLVPRAAEAELFIVAAQLEDKGPALFIVESSTQGLSIEAEPAMGLRAASTGRLLLRDVRLPASALISSVEQDVYGDCVHLARLGWCALATGTAQAVLDYLVPYVNERSAFGEPISHRQAVAFSVANAGIELEGMRLLTWRAASRAERGQSFAREAALARRLCADKGMAIGNDGVQLLGGHGYVKEHPVERWYRDLRAAGLMEGVVLV
ncbi:MAG TPA: acyl-CoA dehydrogenase family protein [Nevskia sp.]|nr:acyl-CoA dehydrogenase family protein [Nevskia sp.]